MSKLQPPPLFPTIRQQTLAKTGADLAKLTPETRDMIALAIADAGSAEHPRNRMRLTTMREIEATQARLREALDHHLITA